MNNAQISSLPDTSHLPDIKPDINDLPMDNTSEHKPAVNRPPDMVPDVNNQTDVKPDISKLPKFNWMRYLNCARNKGEENLASFLHDGSLFYR